MKRKRKRRGIQLGERAHQWKREGMMVFCIGKYICFIAPPATETNIYHNQCLSMTWMKQRKSLAYCMWIASTYSHFYKVKLRNERVWKLHCPHSPNGKHDTMQRMCKPNSPSVSQQQVLFNACQAYQSLISTMIEYKPYFRFLRKWNGHSQMNMFEVEHTCHQYQVLLVIIRIRLYNLQKRSKNMVNSLISIACFCNTFIIIVNCIIL